MLDKAAAEIEMVATGVGGPFGLEGCFEARKRQVMLLRLCGRDISRDLSHPLLVPRDPFVRADDADSHFSGFGLVDHGAEKEQTILRVGQHLAVSELE